MFTNTMTAKEIKAEVDAEFLALCPYFLKLNKSYSSLIKNRRIPIGFNVGIKEFVTKRNNRMIMRMIKDKKELGISFLFKVPQDGRGFRYIIPNLTRSVLIITNHFMDRVIEREGISVKECIDSILYNGYKVYESEMGLYSPIADGLAVLNDEGDNVYTLMTYCSRDMLKGQQIVFREDWDKWIAFLNER